MVRTTLLLSVLLLAPSAVAGLFGGNDAPGRIPVPARDFEAVIEDRGGVRTSLQRVSFDGEVYLFGKLGAAQVTVPFEEIDVVRFEPTDDPDEVTAAVTTVAGEAVRIRVEADRPVFGRTHFGNFRIEASDIRQLDL